MSQLFHFAQEVMSSNDPNEKPVQAVAHPALLNYHFDENELETVREQAQWIVLTTPYSCAPTSNHLSSLTD